ncbi:MAG TPA: hypothetical protein VFO25_08495 [Candidatus Eremiobacteraceae bacterium]|nr:hypothetical protein [Candidatus Eremiobacteraceae bacterium]
MSPQETEFLDGLFGPGVAEHYEADLRLIALPDVALPDGCQPARAMCIYVPQRYMGYDTRLFFQSPVVLKSGVTPAHTTAVLLGRTMYAASINGVAATLPIHQGVIAHLRRYELAI